MARKCAKLLQRYNLLFKVPDRVTLDYVGVAVFQLQFTELQVGVVNITRGISSIAGISMAMAIYGMVMAMAIAMAMAMAMAMSTAMAIHGWCTILYYTMSHLCYIILFP